MAWTAWRLRTVAVLVLVGQQQLHLAHCAATIAVSNASGGAIVHCRGSFLAFGGCGASCGPGIKTRLYKVTRPAANGGTQCDAIGASIRRQCQAKVCPPAPVPCVGRFTAFSECSVSCGAGVSESVFNVTRPARLGGDACQAVGASIRRRCTNRPCPVNCTGAYGDWSKCTNGTNTAVYAVAVNASWGGVNCSRADGYTVTATCKKGGGMKMQNPEDMVAGMLGANNTAKLKKYANMTKAQMKAALKKEAEDRLKAKLCKPGKPCAGKALNASEAKDAMAKQFGNLTKNKYKAIPAGAGISAYAIRLVPMGAAAFMTLFGRQIANLVRVGSVFVASASPGIMVVVQPFMDGSQKKFTVASLTGVAGALYAGTLAAIVAMKRKKFGIMVQAGAVGTILAGVLQGFYTGWVIANVDWLVEYMQWVNMIFAAMVGLTIAKIALKYEDLLSVAATAITGAYTCMQIFCSLGFEFAETLTIGAMLTGTFGCNSYGCFITLGFWCLFGLFGVYNQLKLNKILNMMMDGMESASGALKSVEEGAEDAVAKAKEIQAGGLEGAKAMATDAANDVKDDLKAASTGKAEFTGNSKYERVLIKVNKAFKILYEINDIVKEAGAADGTKDPEKLKKIAREHAMAYIKASTWAADFAQLVLGGGLFGGIGELFIHGCFETELMIMFAAAMIVLGLLIVLMSLYNIKTHRMPTASDEDQHAREVRMNRYLWMEMIVLPIAIGLTTVGGTIAGGPLAVKSVHKFLKIDELPPEALATLETHLPSTISNLQLLVASLTASATMVCRSMGGMAFVLNKLNVFVGQINMLYGAAIAAGAGYMEANMSEEDKAMMKGPGGVPLATFLSGMGGVIVAQSALGIYAGKLNYKTGKSGEFDSKKANMAKTLAKVHRASLMVTAAANGAMFGAAVYYIQNIGTRIDKDWPKMNRKFCRGGENGTFWQETLDDDGNILTWSCSNCPNATRVINAISNCAATGMRRRLEGVSKMPSMLTKEDFVAQAESGMKLLSTAGGLITGMMGAGLGLNKMSTNPKRMQSMGHADKLGQSLGLAPGEASGSVQNPLADGDAASSLGLTGSKEEDQAATKLQATFRGKQSREKSDAKKEGKKAAKEAKEAEQKASKDARKEAKDEKKEAKKDAAKVEKDLAKEEAKKKDPVDLRKVTEEEVKLMEKEQLMTIVLDEMHKASKAGQKEANEAEKAAKKKAEADAKAQKKAEAQASTDAKKSKSKAEKPAAAVATPAAAAAGGDALGGEIGAFTALFKEIDVSGDGTLDQDELAALFKARGMKMSSKEIRKIMKQVDQDKSGTLDFAEFIAWLKSNKEIGALLLDQRLMEQMDDLDFEDLDDSDAWLKQGQNP